MKNIHSFLMAIVFSCSNLISQNAPETIVFSNSRIVENPDLSNLKTEFSGADLIYARCYLAKPINKTPADNNLGEFFVKLFINGTPLQNVPEVSTALENKYSLNYYINNNMVLYQGAKPKEYSTTDEELKKNSEEEKRLLNAKSFEIAINRKEEDVFDLKSYGTGDEQDNLWPLIINSLKPGIYKMKLEVWGGGPISRSGSKSVLATGEFTYTKKIGENISSGKDWKKFVEPAGMTNAELEASMAKAVLEIHGTTITKVLKVIIVDKNWYIIKNEVSGVIIKRRLQAVVLAKDKEGKCLVEERSEFFQDYSGGKYGKTYIKQFSGIIVDCSTVK